MTLVLHEIQKLDRREKMKEGVKAKLDETMKLVTQYGMLPYIAHTQFTLAEYYAKAGDLEKKKSALAEAFASYEKLGMKSWAERVKAKQAIT